MHRPRKRFGQHFLTDASILERMVHAINPREHEVLVEIGPGTGVLTEQLVSRCRKLFAIELDRDLTPKLRARYSDFDFSVVEADVLDVDFTNLTDKETPAEKLRVVGNLPYNLSLIHI